MLHEDYLFPAFGSFHPYGETTWTIGQTQGSNTDMRCDRSQSAIVAQTMTTIHWKWMMERKTKLQLFFFKSIQSFESIHYNFWLRIVFSPGYSLGTPWVLTFHASCSRRAGGSAARGCQALFWTSGGLCGRTWDKSRCWLSHYCTENRQDTKFTNTSHKNEWCPGKDIHCTTSVIQTLAC